MGLILTILRMVRGIFLIIYIYWKEMLIRKSQVLKGWVKITLHLE